MNIEDYAEQQLERLVTKTVKKEDSLMSSQLVYLTLNEIALGLRET